MPSSPRARRLRWAAPLVVAAVIGLVALVPTLSAGAATPTLPPLTAQQLLVKVQQVNVQHLSGTIRLTTNLGLPDLSALSDVAGRGNSGFNPTSLLSGSHDANVWFDGSRYQKIALPSTLAEYDVIHSGTDVWTWDSTTSTVGHTHTAASQDITKPGAPKPAPITTPDQAANELLANIGPSTKVSVTSPVYIARQNIKAYQLVLTPKSAQSTVDDVTIAIDAKTGLPLQVSVFAKGQTTKPAIQLGFTSLSYAKPAASTFAFTPPPGSTMTTNGAAAKSPTVKGHIRHRRVIGTPEASSTPTTPTTATSQKTQYVGQDWTQVIITSMPAQLPLQAGDVLGSAAKVQGGRLLHSALINVLVLGNGRIAIGAVSPAALEAAAASAH